MALEDLVHTSSCSALAHRQFVAMEAAVSALCRAACLCHAGEPQSMNVSDWDALRTPSRLVSALPACKALTYLLPMTMDKRILEVSFLHQLVSPRTEE